MSEHTATETATTGATQNDGPAPERSPTRSSPSS